MNKINFRPVLPQPTVRSHPQRAKQDKQQGDFSAYLNRALKSENKLTLSKHARDRLAERDIHINESRWSLIEEKLAEAKKKGVKDSLILLNDAALIVSAKNNTVITAMNRQEAVSQIFTNINGTIILE